MKTVLVALVLMWSIVPARALELTFTEDPELGESVPYKVMIMDGVIEDGDALKVKKMLKSQTGKRTVFLITSPGGVKEEIPDLARVIVEHAKQSFKKLKKPDLFAINQSCDSSCTILAAEITRLRDAKSLEFFVQADSKFLFHPPLKVFEDGRWLDLSKPSLKAAAFKDMKDSYLKAGVSKEWFGKQESKIKRPKGLVVTARELCQSRSQVIPDASCSNLSSDRFTELINEVFDQNQIFSQNKELKKSLIQDTKKTRGVSRVFQKVFGI